MKLISVCCIDVAFLRSQVNKLIGMDGWDRDGKMYN